MGIGASVPILTSIHRHLQERFPVEEAINDDRFHNGACMSNSDDYEVGYKRPPKATRFKKGQCANPNGRRGKKSKASPAENSVREILERIDNELIEFQGRMITKREAELRVLQASAFKGNARAVQLLEALRQKAGVGKTASGGVLLVPVDVPLDEWEAATARQQAPYREQTFDDIFSEPQEG